METSKKNLSVFLVDDDKMFLMSLKHELKKQFKNIKLSIFASGEDCLKRINDKPDIVVLDYYLNNESPDASNGMEILKKIKSISRDIEVVMLSAQDRMEVAIKAIRNGAYEYVPKSESAIVRVKNSLKNIMYNIEHVRENKTYEKWNYIMAAFLLLFIVSATIYYFTH